MLNRSNFQALANTDQLIEKTYGTRTISMQELWMFNYDKGEKFQKTENHWPIQRPFHSYEPEKEKNLAGQINLSF